MAFGEIGKIVKNVGWRHIQQDHGQAHRCWYFHGQQDSAVEG